MGLGIYVTALYVIALYFMLINGPGVRDG